MAFAFFAVLILERRHLFVFALSWTGIFEEVAVFESAEQRVPVGAIRAIVAAGETLSLTVSLSQMLIRLSKALLKHESVG